MTKPKAKKPAAAKARKASVSVKRAARKPAPARKAPASKPTAKAKPPAKAAAAKLSPAKTAPAKAAAKKPAVAAVAKPAAAKVAPAPAAKPAAVSTAKPAPAPAVKPAAPVAARPAAPGPARPSAPIVAAKPGLVTPAEGVPAPIKKPTVKVDFKAGEYIVYPAHGVGRIVGIDSQEVAGYKLDLFVISFLKDKMTLRVPMMKATSVGMRKLADPNTVKRALETVRGRARIKRTMWSRRAQEYEAKINSGDLISIAEVVRDLFRSENQPEQSYSERQLYEAALDRMSREISSVNRISETEAIRQIEQNLAKSPRRGVKPETVEAPAEDKAAA